MLGVLKNVNSWNRSLGTLKWPYRFYIKRYTSSNFAIEVILDMKIKSTLYDFLKQCTIMSMCIICMHYASGITRLKELGSTCNSGGSSGKNRGGVVTGENKWSCPLPLENSPIFYCLYGRLETFLDFSFLF